MSNLLHAEKKKNYITILSPANNGLIGQSDQTLVCFEVPLH